MSVLHSIPTKPTITEKYCSHIYCIKTTKHELTFKSYRFKGNDCLVTYWSTCQSCKERDKNSARKSYISELDEVLLSQWLKLCED